MISNPLIYLPEPSLLFRYGQSLEDPRDGLTLFGPLDNGPHGIRAGVVGSEQGIRRFKLWTERIQAPILPIDNDEQFYLSHPPFPGFEAAFRIPWNPTPAISLIVPETDLKSIFMGEIHARVFHTVDLYASRIIKAIKEEDVRVDVWFVIVPDDVYKYCRPESRVESALRTENTTKMSPALARRIGERGSLFSDLAADAEAFQYEPNFHHQLKARLLDHLAPVQIIRESTIAHREFLNAFGSPTRNLDSLQPNIAWNICTAAFYKAGGRPWKMAEIRKGVCYIGLVFKQDNRTGDPRQACCAAQMFLDSGDGVVFKGAVGPWYSPEKGDFHLDRISAYNLISLAIETYVENDKKMGGKGDPPRELFIHGKVRFSKLEWDSFVDAAGRSTNTVGVQIRQSKNLKIYRQGSYPMLRGLAYIQDERTAYLWTNGFIPRIQNYAGKEVPNPIFVNVCRGEAPIRTVLQDILALTKLNYNTCKFASGVPVTLKFADAVGEILTAGPRHSGPPLSFKYYI